MANGDLSSLIGSGQDLGQAQDLSSILQGGLGLLALLSGNFELAFPAIGAALAGGQASAFNRQQQETLAAAAPLLQGGFDRISGLASQGVPGLQAMLDRLQTPAFQPGAAAQASFQESLPGLQDLSRIEGPRTDPTDFLFDIKPFEERIQGISDITEQKARDLLSPEALQSAVDPLRQEVGSILEGAKPDPELGQKIIDRLGDKLDIGTPMRQFSNLARKRTELFRDKFAAQDTRGAQARASEQAALESQISEPILAEAEKAEQASRAFRASTETDLLKTFGLQGQDLATRLASREADTLDRIIGLTGAGSQVLANVIGGLGQAGIGATTGLAGLEEANLGKVMAASIDVDRLRIGADQQNFQNALDLALRDAGFDAAAAGDRRDAILMAIKEGRTDQALQIMAAQFGVQGTMQFLAMSLGRDTILTNPEATGTTLAEILANQSLRRDQDQDDFFGLGTAVGGGGGALLGALLAAPTGGLSIPLGAALGGGIGMGVGGGIGGQIS